jgi:hypothetical protein
MSYGKTTEEEKQKQKELIDIVGNRCIKLTNPTTDKTFYDIVYESVYKSGTTTISFYMGPFADTVTEINIRKMTNVV